jgi:hypothetical protein
MGARSEDAFRARSILAHTYTSSRPGRPRPRRPDRRSADAQPRPVRLGRGRPQVADLDLTVNPLLDGLTERRTRTGLVDILRAARGLDGHDDVLAGELALPDFPAQRLGVALRARPDGGALLVLSDRDPECLPATDKGGAHARHLSPSGELRYCPHTWKNNICAQCAASGSGPWPEHHRMPTYEVRVAIRVEAESPDEAHRSTSIASHSRRPAKLRSTIRLLGS